MEPFSSFPPATAGTEMKRFKSILAGVLAKIAERALKEVFPKIPCSLPVGETAGLQAASHT